MEATTEETTMSEPEDNGNTPQPSVPTLVPHAFVFKAPQGFTPVKGAYVICTECPMNP